MQLVPLQRGVKHDGNFGAFLDAMCDKVFGITQLVLIALNVIAPEVGLYKLNAVYP